MSWQAALLAAIGAPSSQQNLAILEAWHRSEGTPDEIHNPLATTLRCCGGVAWNGAGVQRYPDEASGVDATARTLLYTRGGDAYAGVVAALRADAGAVAVYQAVNASPWCRGCSAGRYPVRLYELATSGRFGGGATLPRSPAVGWGLLATAILGILGALWATS